MRCSLSIQEDLAQKQNYSVQRILTKMNGLETNSDDEKTCGAKHKLLSPASGDGLNTVFSENLKLLYTLKYFYVAYPENCQLQVSSKPCLTSCYILLVL